jgi:hypothetical protein
LRLSHAINGQSRIETIMLTLTLREPRPTLLIRFLDGVARLNESLDLAFALRRLDADAARDVLERRGLIGRAALDGHAR